jgi:ADP-ribose pyrophosphatase YjhB (NUDIX family)
MSFPFNVRVYGALICDGHILLSHEVIRDFAFTKLPGGGLEFGEGTADALKREFFEETGLEVEITDHLYTTDFFQVSAFNSDHQIISIYYSVRAKTLNQICDIKALEENQRFEWKQLAELSEIDFTFPIDKRMVGMLKVLGGH